MLGIKLVVRLKNKINLLYAFLILNKLASEIAIILLYIFSFVVLTYPLITHFASGILGWYNSDAPIFLWNSWEWQKKISSGTFNFITNDIFYPFSTSLYLHTNTMVESLVVVALNIIFRNLVFSFNLVFLFSSVASAYFTYRWLLLLTKSRAVSFLAGHFFGFQHLWSVYSLFGTRNLLGFWYIPAVIYLYELHRQREKLRYLFFATVVLGLAFLNDFIIFSFTAASVFLYGLVSFLWLETKSIKKVFQRAAVVLIGFLLISGWKIFFMVQNNKTIGFLPVPTTADVDVYYGDVINLLRPSRFHGLWGHLGTLFTHASLFNGNAFIGFAFVLVVLVFIVIRLVMKRKFKNKNFIICAVIFGGLLLLSFGPFLHVVGFNTGILMPYFFLAKIYSQVNNLRVAARWLFPAMLFLAGIFSFLLVYILESLKDRSRAIRFTFLGCIYILLILDVFFWPKNIIGVSKNISPLYQKLAQKEAGTVVEIPLAITSGYFTLGESARINMLHQTIHGFPILGGHVSRLSPNVQEFYKSEPVIKYLLHYKLENPDKNDMDNKLINNFFSKYNARYFILDKKLANFNNESGKKLVAYLKNQLKLELLYDDAEVVAFYHK